MKSVVAFVAAVALCSVVLADGAKPVEVWECKDFVSPGPVLVTAMVESNRDTGNITVAGVTQATVFNLAGFNRRWDFGLLSDGTYKYAFVIEPNGDGEYFDFGREKNAHPSSLMKCRQTVKR